MNMYIFNIHHVSRWAPNALALERACRIRLEMPGSGISLKPWIINVNLDIKFFFKPSFYF
jgi:hypothetical protein